MAERAVLPSLPAFKANVHNVYLLHARFLEGVQPSEPIPPLPQELEIGLNLAFARRSVRELTIALGVTVPMTRPYSVEVMYAGDFALSDSVPDEEVEAHWRQTAATLAPIVLYPYIRELVADLTRRSQAEDLTLPVLAFGGIDVDGLQVPPYSPGDADQLGVDV